ncbi:flagellar hook-associated protein FlgK [Phycisphaerales bacterium AB-hyl4]|uniref:Flagellar hook-associated protein 1 n=1 Tax=Natronomicrosphaera hydrolytica TaxID=3242702 RepID=A0ABV4U770_9BACT
MSLGNALNIGRSGLLNSQTALQTVGHNLTNAATPGYRRQSVALQPAGSQRIDQGTFVGQGVQLQAITRQINEALESRLRGATADESKSGIQVDLFAQLEAIQGEYDNGALSGQLGAFFNAWSNLANNPQDTGLRALVTEEAEGLIRLIEGQHQDLVAMRTQIDKTAGASAEHINELLGKIEQLNSRISQAEAGQGGANDLRDQRDMALSELAQHLDISTVEHGNGKVDVFVGSLPIVIDGKSRGVELHERTIDGEPVTQLRVKADGSALDLRSGQLGGMLAFRDGVLAEAINTLDTFAHQLIGQVNHIHSQGQGTSLFDEVTGTTKVKDPDAVLNSEAAGLAYPPGHGSFQLHLTQKSTGQTTSHTIDLDLDGIDGDDITFNDLVSQINDVANVNASITNDGRLRIATDTGDFQLSFSDDSSGVLASLGINTFFTGSKARDIGVNPTIRQSPGLLAVGQNHEAGDNSNALAIADLRKQGVDALGGNSLTEYWNRHVEQLASQASNARNKLASDQTVRENLQTRQQSISGVNIDEEAIDLMRYQSSYQASARFLSVVDEMMRTLLAMV